MAADPVAAAQQLAGQTYAGAQERTAATQKALLDSMAANGTYQNSLNTATTAAAAPQAAPTGPAYNNAYPELGAIANQGQQQVSTMGQAALAAATALAAHHAATAQQANTDYFTQAAAAMPLEQSRASSAAAQVLGDLQAKREAEAAAKAQAAIQLQISQAELAKAKLSSAASSQFGGPLFNSPVEQQSFAANAKQNAASQLAGLGAIVNGQPTPTGAAYNAAKEMAQSGASLAQVTKKYGLGESDQQAVADAINNYNNSLTQQHYYDYMGLTPPPEVTIPAKSAALNKFAGSSASGSVKAPAKAATPAKASTSSKQPVPVYGPTGAIVGYK